MLVPGNAQLGAKRRVPDVVFALQCQRTGNGDGLQDIDEADNNGQPNLAAELGDGGEVFDGGAWETLGNVAHDTDVVGWLHQAPNIHDGDGDDSDSQGPECAQQLQLAAWQHVTASGRLETADQTRNSMVQQ